MKALADIYNVRRLAFIEISHSHCRIFRRIAVFRISREPKSFVAVEQRPEESLADPLGTNKIFHGLPLLRVLTAGHHCYNKYVI